MISYIFVLNYTGFYCSLIVNL